MHHKRVVGKDQCAREHFCQGLLQSGVSVLKHFFNSRIFVQRTLQHGAHVLEQRDRTAHIHSVAPGGSTVDHDFLESLTTEHAEQFLIGLPVLPFIIDRVCEVVLQRFGQCLCKNDLI